jgi:hypothetical protein
VIACFAAAACLLAPFGSGAGRTRPPVSLVAAPAHVALAGAARQVVTLTSSGTRPVVVEVVRAGYGLDLRGRPRILPHRRSWVSVRPRRVAIAPGGHATLVVVSSPPRRAEPGDHSELLLLTTRPLRTASLSVKVRLGLVVVVRAPGRIVRRLTVSRVRLRAHRLELLVANRGNVTETIARRCFVVTVRRARRVVRLHPTPRRILPHALGLVAIPFRRARGPLRVAVALSPGPPCPTPPSRSFVVRPEKGMRN